MNLILFDFDNTLTVRNSMWSFLKFAVPGPAFYWKAMRSLPSLLLYIFGLRSAETAKANLIMHFLGNRRKDELEAVAVQFCNQRLNSILNQKIFKAFMAEIDSGAEVCIVTASCSLWVQDFARKYKVALIATELEFSSDGILTGKFSTPNCNHEEKVIRIKAKYNLSSYRIVKAYGNKGGDDEMFAIANEKLLVA